MIRLLQLFLLCCLSSSALAQAPTTGPLVQTSIVPSEGIVIGQPVRLHIKVMFPGEMLRPPLVKITEASGAQIMRFETQALTVRDSVDGQDYVGQTFEFVVFPRRGGDIQVPAADVTLLDRKGDPIGSVRGQPLRFAVTVPAGIDPSGPVLAASDVSVSESWSPASSSTFKVGGAITRIIRRRAADVPALGMAEFRFTAPAGVRAYVDPPAIDDKINRGSVEGIRTDKVTYVFEKPGTYALPALTQPWWDIDDRQLRSETLDGITIAVAAAAPLQPDWRALIGGWQGIIVGGSGSALLLWLLVQLRPQLIVAWRRHRQRHLSSEAFARKALRKAARTGDASATYRALRVWSSRLSPGARQRLGQDSRLNALVNRLERSLFGQGEKWSRQSGVELAKLALRIGSVRLEKRRIQPSALPPLNPIGRP
ncbi:MULTISPECIES: BatD family protein [unclassified Bosea (in: a-proteobacteria)]|uniref:BatD family protein n=1 Tax=unclassified Bosea (in: a-proteobacteria) TaxID=2653178 RepID=UPI000F74C486|nr:MULTISPECIES: BatD family protein [unclassified Bosea (in: a-proteobacteria)]AZO76443.1 hypothetical protein BLM15_01610 [Bosea sp. Tri-49]RXT26370.1 hypothetical protein B5U98_07525 [Bosea sp. Tri-39]RXT31610.1 hypothetical protein B5U99_23070 [Bosea sp. Tri-54]